MNSIRIKKGGLEFALHRHQVLALAALFSLVIPQPGGNRTASSDNATPKTVSARLIATGDLNTGRGGHTATLLPNGKVLVVGGYTQPFSATKSAELYDPATGSWKHTGDLNVPRVQHTATLLAGGKVLVAGGITSAVSPFKETNTTELYDVETGTWSFTGILNDATAYHTATLLENGKVLVAGGRNQASPLNNAELYNPDTGSWTITDSLVAARFWQTATLLKDGKVLLTGGLSDPDLLPDLYSALASAELYDPETGKWSATANLGGPQGGHTATLLPSGQVLVAGAYFGTAELYDPATGAWKTTAKSSTARARHTAILLANGEVMIAGGYDLSGLPSNIVEHYNPETKEWIVTSTLGTARTGHTATLLQDGRVLVAGGFDRCCGSTAPKSAELYDPAGIPSRPKIIGAMVTGKKLFIIGENFDPGAVVLLNGEEQKTRNDELNPNNSLIAKKAGKRVKSGDKLRVRNPNGLRSEEFTFTTN